MKNSHVFSLFFLAANARRKFSIKCYTSTSIYLIFKNETMIQHVCLGFWFFKLIYYFLTITYINVSNLIQDPIYIIYKHSKTTKTIRQMKSFIQVLYIQKLEALKTTTKKNRIFLQQQNTPTCFIVTETWINDNQKIPLNLLRYNYHFLHQSR